VTPLDGSCEVVLGHNWLRDWNPTIDWSRGIVVLTNPPKPAITPEISKSPEPPTQTPTPTAVDRPHISLVNALAYQRACKTPGAVLFQLQLSGLQEVTGRTGQVRDDSPDLSGLPTDYHQYAEVFSKEMSKQLPPHCPYDLSIQLESEKTPPLGPIYSLSALELQMLREFINENLCTGFIRPS